MPLSDSLDRRSNFSSKLRSNFTSQEKLQIAPETQENFLSSGKDFYQTGSDGNDWNRLSRNSNEYLKSTQEWLTSNSKGDLGPEFIETGQLIQISQDSLNLHPLNIANQTANFYDSEIKPFTNDQENVFKSRDNFAISNFYSNLSNSNGKKLQEENVTYSLSPSRYEVSFFL